MNIIIITQGLSRVVGPLINSNHNIIAIIESAPRAYAKGSFKIKLRRKLIGLESLFRTNPTTLKELCKKKGIFYRFMTSSNDAGLEEWVQSLKPDLIVVYSMSQLLRKNIFSIARYGTINLHSSFLPEYRGPNPDFWQYHDQVTNTGVSVHFVDAGEDTGDIIFQERVFIPLGTKSPDRLDRLIGDFGVRILSSAIEAINNGTVLRCPQPRLSPTVRARNIKEEEHRQIIDWKEWPVERVWNLMRGTELWLECIEQPGGIYRGQRWIVADYEKGTMQDGHENIGGIMKDPYGFFVSCRDGKIRLNRKFSIRRALRALFKL